MMTADNDENNFTTFAQFITGAMCACSGILIVALPVSVIGSNFSLFYSHAQAQLKLPCKRKQPVLVGVASALMSTVEPGLESSSGSDSESGCDSASETKYKTESKCLLDRAESAKDVQVPVETIEMRRKMTPDARPPWFQNQFNYESRKNSRSLESKRGGVFSCGSPEMGLEKGLKAMGDIMLNIAAPTQRRMAISGVSLAHSPSLRRSNSGKRRPRSKSGDSFRKRANTSGSDNCRGEGFDDLFQSKETTPMASLGGTELSMNEPTTSTSDGDQTIKPGNDHSIIAPEEQTAQVEMNVEARKNYSDALQDGRNPSSPEPLLETTPREKIITPNHMLDKKQAKSMENINSTKENEYFKSAVDSPTREGTPDLSDTPRVLDYNKLSPWYTKTNKGSARNGPTFPRFGRRRSATIDICNV